MRYLEPIYWRHGVFLQPHHFQYADKYFQNLLIQSAQLGLTHPWGIVKLDINQEKFKQNLIEFNALDLIFEDGTRINIENNAIIGDSRFNADKIGNNKIGYKIYAGIKKLVEGQVNVTLIDKTHDIKKVKTRFISLVNEVYRHNIYEGGEMAHVERLKYVVHIFDEDSIKNAQGFDLIPVLKLIRHEGQIVIDQDYVPPLLATKGYKYFLIFIENLYNAIHDQAKQLELYKLESFMQDGYEGKHQGESRLISGYRLALQTLARYLMEFSAYRQSNSLHPWYLYKLLTQMIAELSLFSSKIDVNGVVVNDSKESLQNYDHYDLQKTFTSIKNIIQLLLGDISLQPEMFIEMKFDGTNRFGIMIPDNFFGLGQEFYLGIVTKVPTQSWLNEFINFAKIASESIVKELSSHALPGLQLIYMNERPQGIPNRPNTSYFKVVKSGYAWESVQKTRSLVVFWDKSPQDCQMNLSVVKG